MNSLKEEIPKNEEDAQNETQKIKAPINKIKLEFNEINYSLKTKTKRQILKNCSGVAYPGRFLAILGTSGAGKTSLLNILSGRLRGNKKYKVTGEIKLNGDTTLSRELFQQNTAYVLQEDLLYETLRAREVFMLSAIIRLSKDITIEEKKKNVDRIISELGIEKCADSLIGGNQIQGVSGGERKRVSIGNELITNPSLFFLDEPTSGLDSYTAFKIVELLKLLADSGRTVIATFHQPNSNMFLMFDDLLVISEGNIVYQGPTEHSVTVFDKMGYPLPPNCNPADHFISVTHVQTETDSEKIIKMAKSFKPLLEEIEGKDIDYKTKKSQAIKPQTIRKPNFFEQTYHLIFKQSLRNYFRTPSSTYIRAAQTIIFSLICGIIFFDMQYTQMDAYGRKAAIFFITINLTFSAVLNVIYVFPSEKKIFQHEMANGMYSSLAYFCSKILVEMPINVLSVIVYQLIVYWMINLSQTLSQFFLLFLLLVISTQIGYFLGMLIGVVARSPKLGNTLSSFVLLPTMLFAGFFSSPDKMQKWVGWITYLNFVRYIVDMAVYNEFNDDIARYKFCTTPDQCITLTGKEILQKWGLEDLNFWGWYGITLAFLVFYSTLTYVILKIKADNNIGKPLKAD